MTKGLQKIRVVFMCTSFGEEGMYSLYLYLSIGQSVAESSGDFPQFTSTDHAIFVQVKHFKMVSVKTDLLRGELCEFSCHFSLIDLTENKSTEPSLQLS